MKIKILVVDDVAANRALIRSFLSMKGFDVEVAEDGMKAYQAIRKNKYDLIFSDVEMPNMNGFEFLKRARSLPQYKTIPIIMLTSLNAQEHINTAKKLGASFYILKPFTKEKFDSILNRLDLSK